MKLAAYIHFPWCLQRCPYCDFATEAIAQRELPHAEYASAVVAEISARATDFGGAALGTVFFGGGTPSLWHPTELGRVLAALIRQFGSPDEVTVECNPTSLDRTRAEALRAEGVTRVSVGVQSLRERHLRFLGRLHDADAARRAIADAVGSGMLRVSADLMFGMPDQRQQELVEDARELIGAGVEHISAYSLTIEPATRFGELARKGKLPRLADDDVADLYDALEAVMDDAGWGHYEVSNYARAGAEARHNQAYWRGEAYLGLGAGAVGCWHEQPGRRVRYRNVYDVPGYLRSLGEGVRPPEEREVLDADAIVREGLMLGLRTREGADLRGLARESGSDARTRRARAIERAVAQGNLEDHGERLVIPRSRWLLADGIVAGLF